MAWSDRRHNIKMKFELGVNSGDFICHYTQSKTLIEILRSKKLRFSSSGRLNDPRESLRVKDSNYSWDGLSMPNGFDELVRQIVSKGLKICSFSIEGENALPVNHLDCCYSLLNMWAYYAEGFYGAGLVFDKKELIKQIPNVFKPKFINVEYDESPQTDIYSYGYINKLFEENDRNIKLTSESYIENKVIPVFYKKDKNWSLEKEFRILINDSYEEEYQDIPYEISLKAIFLGIFFPEKLLLEVKKYLPTNVKLYEMFWDDYSNHYGYKVIEK